MTTEDEGLYDDLWAKIVVATGHAADALQDLRAMQAHGDSARVRAQLAALNRAVEAHLNALSRQG